MRAVLTGVYLDLLPSLEMASLKGFIARHGRPHIIYSDNGSMFKAADWMSRVRKDEKFHHYLAQHDVAWRFNLNRAPWWGGTSRTAPLSIGIIGGTCPQGRPGPYSPVVQAKMRESKRLHKKKKKKKNPVTLKL